MKEWLYRHKRAIQKNIYSIYYKYANNRYAVAFRQRNATPLYEEQSTGDGFVLVKNTLRYWIADPFLVKYEGVNYLFAELYDKHKSKGVLGYAKLSGNHCSKFRVCHEEEYHLSYPCIFQRGNNMYMIPETKENNTVTIYKAVKFPDKWEKVETICSLPCVDTTPFIYNHEAYFFTTIANDHSTDDNLFLINDKTRDVTELLVNNLCLRSAGNVIFDKGKMIRPSQDDTVYGDAVIFNNVVNFSDKNYKEIPYKRILPPGQYEKDSISVNLVNNSKNIQFNGLHTYNVNEDYEVIDLRYPRLKK